MRSRISTKIGAVLATGAALALTAGLASVLGEELIQPVDFAHNVVDAPAPIAGAVFGTAGAQAGTAICTTPPRPRANVNTDCEKRGGRTTRRRSRSIRPTRYNMIGGANDYQLGAQSRRPRHPDDALPRARHLRRRPDLVRVSDQRQLGVPGNRRPGGGLRCDRARLLRDARVPVRRPGQRR